MMGIKIGDRMREIRLSKKKSRGYVAEQAGIDTETLARYERNEREPVISVLKAIAENGLDCSLEDLLDSNPTPPPAESQARQGKRRIPASRKTS